MTLSRIVLAIAMAALCPLWAQSTTGDILGTVYDASGAVVTDARVIVRNLDTNSSKEAATGSDGIFRFPLLPTGNYEVTVEKPGFTKYVQGPIVLTLNRSADLRVNLQVGGTSETVTVQTDAPLINTTNAEIGVNFDAKRISELPLSTNRNVMNLFASVPGVSQISVGNAQFGSSGNQGTDQGVGLQFSANGMRTRSNAFIIDGQDSYGPSTGGLVQPLNNPDIIAEVRVLTNQFAAEYGRTAGSVVNVITKSGTNQFHGSAFWFHNNNQLNTLSNTDKRAGFREAPYRTENQFGGTVGGPVLKDRTFFFASLQKWTDRRLGTGRTLRGAPTAEGRAALQNLAGNVNTVRAFLENIPDGVANGQSRTVTYNGRSAVVPLGDITGAASQRYGDWQGSIRGDHRFSDQHNLSLRYLVNDYTRSGTGQVTPAGLTDLNLGRIQSATAAVTSTFSATLLNELRLSFWRNVTSTNSENPAVAERIPSIEVADLGLTEFNAGPARTALGLATNNPQYSTLNNYQIQESLSVIRGTHTMKFGLDFRRQEQFAFFNPNIRGRLEYATLQRLINDQATTAQINTPIGGASAITSFRYYDYFFFLQDEWRVTPSLTLSYGIRYESPGNPLANLADVSQVVVNTFGGDQRYAYTPVPNRDTNNWAPRFGFNYRFGQAPGILGWLTGDNQLVLRGGYSRTYDVAFNNIALNVGTAFPFRLVFDAPAVSDPATGANVRPNAFTLLENVRAGNVPPPANPNLITRTITSKDFRAPLAEQFSLQIQRQLPGDWAFSIGGVSTKGTGLFQSIDGNRPIPGTAGTQRIDPTRGIIRERCNCTSSIYHSLQTSLEKRLSRNFSMAAHYTWSSFIDGASEVFNPSASAEVAFPQNPLNRDAERGRSTYDRPHRFTVNGVFELPFFRSQQGVFGRILGGWQVNGFFTLQSGAPFTVLTGVDPGGIVTGNLVGTSIRPFLNTDLDLSSMSVREIQRAGGASLFRTVSVQNPIGDAGRNILRADGINRLDFGLLKNFRVTEGNTLQLSANFFNATNTRDWSIPDARLNSPAFLDEGAPEAANRRIQLGLRYTF
jgi:hypothetical protein